MEIIPITGLTESNPLQILQDHCSSISQFASLHRAPRTQPSESCWRIAAHAAHHWRALPRPLRATLVVGLQSFSNNLLLWEAPKWKLTLWCGNQKAFDWLVTVRHFRRLWVWAICSPWSATTKFEDLISPEASGEFWNTPQPHAPKIKVGVARWERAKCNTRRSRYWRHVAQHWQKG